MDANTRFANKRDPALLLRFWFTASIYLLPRHNGRYDRSALIAITHPAIIGGAVTVYEEYKSLRDEIHVRVKNRMWLLSLPTVVVAGLIAAVARFDEGHMLLLTGPVLCLFVSLEWSYNDCRIADIAIYIRHFYETKESRFRWQKYLAEVRTSGDVDRIAQTAACGIFMGGSLTSVFVFWLTKAETNWQLRVGWWALFAVLAVLLILIFVFVTSRHRHVQTLSRKIKEPNIQKLIAEATGVGGEAGCWEIDGLNCSKSGHPRWVQSDLSVVDFLAFTEGPAVDSDGTVYFSDIKNNRIMMLQPDGVMSVFREDSGRTNGQAFDHEGRLYHCEGSEFGDGGRRRITRTNDLKSRECEVITSDYRGVRYNSPNDICIDGRGRAYFTDPRYGDRDDMEMEIEGVYRIDLSGHVERILEQPCIQRPNGIAVTQDSRTLYVVDSCPEIGGNRKVWAFDLNDNGTPSNQREVYDFGSGRGGDGIRLDIDGNLYVAAGIMTPRGPHESAEVPPGIYVIKPDGRLMGRIPVFEDVLTNLAFGGVDGRTLYVTAGKSLLKTRAPVPGQVAFPKWRQ